MATFQPHDLSNLFSPGKYLNKLAPDNISHQYFNGLKYKSDFWNRTKLLFNIKNTLEELSNFYPHENIVQQTFKKYKQ